MISKSIAHRLANIERKMQKSLLPLVLFYRESSGLSLDQERRIDSAKAEGRSIKLIRTTVVSGNDEVNG